MVLDMMRVTPQASSIHSSPGAVISSHVLVKTYLLHLAQDIILPNWPPDAGKKASGSPDMCLEWALRIRPIPLRPVTC